MKNTKSKKCALVDANGCLVCEGSYDKLLCSDLDRESVKSAELRFIDEIGTCLGHLELFPNLRSLLIMDSHGQGGVKEYGRLAKLTGLQKLCIRDSANVDAGALSSIAKMSNLTCLRLSNQRIGNAGDLKVLAGMRLLRNLSLDVNESTFNPLFVDDLKFIEKMDWLECLDVSELGHIDLSKFKLPRGLKKIVVPRYTKKDVRARLAKRCEVEVDGPICSPNRYRFIKPEKRESAKASARKCCKSAAVEAKIARSFKMLMESLKSKNCNPVLVRKLEKTFAEVMASAR